VLNLNFFEVAFFYDVIECRRPTNRPASLTETSAAFPASSIAP
jgi:hypothetical protein